MHRKLTAICTVGLLALPALLEAQAGPYPALQPTRVATREYNFALSDLQGGTALVFQWREGLDSPRLQFTAELGVVDLASSSGASLGGSFHYQLTTATADMPFDMVFGGGIGLTAFDDLTLFRIPVGVAVGHRFPLEGEFAVSPFVHPRLSIDRASAGGASDTETNLDIDIGASFELNTQMQLRLAATIGEAEAVAISFVWLPRGLR